MFRVTRVATALVLAVAVFTLPLALNECAATCELHQKSATAEPVCHHASPLIAKVGQWPMPCGHDHNGVVTTSATPLRSERAFTPFVALVSSHAPAVAAFVTTHSTNPLTGGLHDLPALRLSVSLRI